MNIESISIFITTTIREAIACIDRGGCGIALVVDAERRLIGTVTDGDVRRAILAALDLEAPVSALLARKVGTQYPKPVTAQVGAGREELLALMRQHVLRQILILDDDGHVVDVVMLDDLVPTDELPLQAVIMAGGLGTRLRPLTEELPKPMLPVGGKPLMERVIEQLRQAGIRRVNLTTHYMSEKIIEHFGDGSAFGVELSYVNEDRPLGTGGALGLMQSPQEPVLVINGDILTQVNFRAMFEFHQEQKADLTVAVRRYEMQVPYGVIECEGARVRRLQEKPQVGFFVNAGIYLLEPSVYQFIPQNTSFNMTDLIQWLLDAGRTVVSFPVHEYWLDIGQYSDYQHAQEDVRNDAFRK
ncbi:MAG: nucleotidyltransferase family protein [Candidatus Atribacteria bacterium]|nr:nucleotidyltransferase family protein [Candidatus Atribacteria bacterium]